MTKDLVILHHGKMEVSSTIERGNTFSITIPINKDAFAEDEIDEAISSEDVLELQAEETGSPNISALSAGHDETEGKKKPV